MKTTGQKTTGNTKKILEAKELTVEEFKAITKQNKEIIEVFKDQRRFICDVHFDTWRWRKHTFEGRFEDVNTARYPYLYGLLFLIKEGNSNWILEDPLLFNIVNKLQEGKSYKITLVKKQVFSEPVECGYGGSTNSINLFDVEEV
jgi:hypothetical protein